MKTQLYIKIKASIALFFALLINVIMLAISLI